MTSQEDWVLLSASADQPKEAVSQPSLSDPALTHARAINRDAPSELNQRNPSLLDRPIGDRWAILLPGELRCLQRSEALLRRLGRHADLFVVTKAKFRYEAKQLHAKHALIVDDDPAEAAAEAALPHGAMKQWHKLSLALKMVKQEELTSGKRYDYIVKLRSDYFYTHPRHLFREIRHSLSSDNIDMVGASDKVFAARRDTMMLMQAFYASLMGWYYQREHCYWPINLDQVLSSDDAIKWYGMNWPTELIGTPQTTQSWRELLVKNRDELRLQLQSYQASTDSTYHKLFRGDNTFASEVCFARFLNFAGISFRDCTSLRGFLYSDR